MRLAMAYVHDRELAEDVVQEAWLTMIRTLGRFEGRSSLKTWISGIVINLARARRRKESRVVALTTFLGDFAGRRRPTVDPARFGADGAWLEKPRSWDNVPESTLLAKETMATIRSAIDDLPAKHREVILLRDVAQLDAVEVARTLGISAENQRVRLHRARATVRRKLEEYLA